MLPAGPPAPPEQATAEAEPASKGLLFDLSGVDRSARVLDRKGIEAINPHRGVMALLDAIVWRSDCGTMGVGVRRVREDEFWVPGHFPGRPLFPGVLMIETGAQLACYMFNVRRKEPALAAFLRIDSAAFRSQVVPGDELLVLCKDVKFQRKRFISDVQGLVGERIAFEARISGMLIGQRAD